MTPVNMSRFMCLLTIVFHVHCVFTYKVKKDKLMTDQSTTDTLLSVDETTDTMSRLEALEESNAELKRLIDFQGFEQKRIKKRLDDVENTLAEYPITDLVERLEDYAAQNSELIKMLANFEKFFGALYAETPEAFDPTKGIDRRMSRLNSYLGNREAELLSLRPVPPTVVANETINAELLGTALYKLDEESQKIDKKLRNLERKVETIERGRGHENSPGQNKKGTGDSDSIPGVDTTEATMVEQERGNAGRRDEAKNGNQGEPDTLPDPLAPTESGATSGCNARKKRDLNAESHDDLYERLERLETLMFLNMYPIVNDSASTTDDPTERSMDAWGNVYTEEQIRTIEDELVEMRTASTSKKTAFSAARTRHMFGESFPQIIDFDHVYVNKGSDFFTENSTFICEITGYYFVSFNFRSFDGYHLGVTLMKNEDVLTSIFTDANNRNVMESQSIITHLSTGDNLWLRHSPSTRFGFHSDQYKYTTFSGFLIFKGT